MFSTRTITLTAIAITLTACATPKPQLICDRSAQKWNKYGTQEDVCVTQPAPLAAVVRDGSEGPTPPHTPPTNPEDPEDPETQKERKNNGLGNGDQKAPGRSLLHNKAENQVGNPGHPSGKEQRSN